MPDPNRRTWQEFEDVVERLYRKLHKNAIVKRDDRLPGKASGQIRQVDVSVRYQLGPNQLLIIVECKRHGRKIDLEEVGTFISKMADVGANMGMMVAERGFTKGAHRLADNQGVKLYELRDTRNEKWPGEMTVKVFVESCTLLIRGWDLVSEDGTRPKFNPADILHLVDNKNLGEEIFIEALVRKVWRDQEERDGDFNVEFKCGPATFGNEGAKDYKFRISFRAETKRFSRDASLELLGLVEADETTHTDAFKIVTQPGKQATYFSKPGFWKTLKANFALLLKSSLVVRPNQVEDQKSLAQGRLLAMLSDSHVEVTAKAGEKPISLNFMDNKKSNGK